MNKTMYIILSSILCVSIIGSAFFVYQTEYSFKSRAKERVANMLIDPPSARFYKVKVAKNSLAGDSICGYVTGHNRAGGYGERKWFAATPDKAVISNHLHGSKPCWPSALWVENTEYTRIQKTKRAVQQKILAIEPQFDRLKVGDIPFHYNVCGYVKGGKIQTLTFFSYSTETKRLVLSTSGPLPPDDGCSPLFLSSQNRRQSVD